MQDRRGVQKEIKRPERNRHKDAQASLSVLLTPINKNLQHGLLNAFGSSRRFMQRVSPTPHQISARLTPYNNQGKHIIQCPSLDYRDKM